MNNFNNNTVSRVFLDTAFLVSFSIKGHKDFPKAQKMLAKLMLKRYMYISPLCFYELWKGIKEYNDFYKGNFRFLRRFNKVLKFIRLKILFDKINFSYKQVINDLRYCTNKIKDSKFITVANLKNNDIEIALNAIDKFDTRPGDAFHFAVIKGLNINTIIRFCCMNTKFWLI